MEGVIFCCPPAWRKLLPPGVLGAERAEALAEQYWPLLVLTRRGCGELGDTAALCRVLLVPGTVPRRWSASRRRRWSPMACPPGTVSPCPAWRNRSSASSGSCLGRAAAWWSPRNFPCRNFRLLRRSCCRCWACGCCSCHRQVPPLCGRLKTKRGAATWRGMRFWRRGSFWRALRFTVGRRTAGRADLPAASAVASAWRTASAF